MCIVYMHIRATCVAQRLEAGVRHAHVCFPLLLLLWPNFEG